MGSEAKRKPGNMRLYLSSNHLGNHPSEILRLVPNGKRTAVIINAKDNLPREYRYSRLAEECRNLAKLGLQPEELDLRDFFGRAEALSNAVSGIEFFWVMGGNSFLLRKAFKQSGFDQLLVELINTDKVAYGGFSAAVCVLGSSLRGIELVDSENVQVEGYDSNVIWDGLGLLKYVVVPHYQPDQVELEGSNKCIDFFINNHVLFKALRDGEVILIDGEDEKILV